VIATQGDATNRMCMLVKTLNELTEGSQELVDITKTHLTKFLAEFVLIFEKAKAFGELDESKDVQVIANYLQIQMTGLRTHVSSDFAMLVNVNKDTKPDVLKV